MLGCGGGTAADAGAVAAQDRTVPTDDATDDATRDAADTPHDAVIPVDLPPSVEDAAMAEDAATAPDAPFDTGAAPDAASQCSVEGDWTANTPSRPTPLYVRLAGGSLETGGRREDLGTPLAIPLGSYTVQGDTLVFLNTVGPLLCLSSSVGRYRVTFEASCARWRLSLLDDPCTQRSRFFDQSTLQR